MTMTTLIEASLAAVLLAGCTSPAKGLETSEQGLESSPGQVAVQQTVKPQFDITNYQVYVDVNDIQRDTKNLGGSYGKYYDKYIQYLAPNGKPVTLVAQDQVTDEQLLRATMY